VKVSARYTVSLVAIGLVLAAAGSGYGYWRLRPPPAAPQVIFGSGRIEADEVRVGVEVAGRLLRNSAVEGQSVRARDIIAVIDPGDYQLQAERAAAQREAASRSGAQVDAQIRLSAHHAQTARTNLERFETLSREGWVSAQRLDLERNATVAAEDQVATLRQQRGEADAQGEVASKSLALAQSMLAKTRIYAPVSGAVLERLSEPGEVIAAGQPVAILADLSTVRLKVFISERDLGKLRLGAPARMRVDAFPDRYFTARVARVDAQAQFTPRDVHMEDERSRTVYGVMLEAPNPEGRLKPGMPADAWILWDAAAGWPALLRPPE
jgi:HlyD family secretion protein